MSSAGPPFDPGAIEAFRYTGVEVDSDRGELRCTYALDDAVTFEEVIDVGAGQVWTPAAHEAARLVDLLAGVSDYQAAAPGRIDLGDTPLRDGETAFLRSFYLDGLGEYAYRNDLDLSGLEIVGGADAGPPVTAEVTPGRPLIPFGGGIDSLVTVDAHTGRDTDVTLFVVDRRGDRFAAIEDAAAITGLPIRRAHRTLDPKVLRSRELGYRNGHVPVTGVISAIAILSAVLGGHDSVVMSNEWSSSAGNLVVDGRTVNHQFSKSLAFEEALAGVLGRAVEGGPAYHSFLRPYSELRIARRFSRLTRFHGTFRSCNRAFHIDPAQRWTTWCGRCDKCCFIDLILSPWMPRTALEDVFGGAEPLADLTLLDTFRTLVGVGGDVKPWECVGDVDESAAAAFLAADREDRAETPVLRALVADLGEAARPSADDVRRLLEPLGPSHAPFGLGEPDVLV